MSKPRFLADEDFRNPLVQAVRRLEPQIDIVSVHEMKIAGTKDNELLQLAAEFDRIIISHDVNTLRFQAELRLAGGLPMSGLFLTRQSIPPRVFVENLLLIWSASEHEEWLNRIEHLPL